MGEQTDMLHALVDKLARIGYEEHIIGAYVYNKPAIATSIIRSNSNGGEIYDLGKDVQKYKQK